ncbi:hypothetical protein GCM10027570_33920 [Streptomonospora sediminis]
MDGEDRSCEYRRPPVALLGCFAGMLAFPAGCFFSCWVIKYIKIGCAGPFPEPAASRYISENSVYFATVPLGGLLLSVLAVLCYSFIVWKYGSGALKHPDEPD